MTSRLAMTTAEFRKLDIPYWIVENYNSFNKKRVDLFHIFDLIVLDNGIVGIQVCGKDIEEHRQKMMVEHAANTIAWLENKGRAEVWAWRKKKARLKSGKIGKSYRWSPRIFDVLLVSGELYWEERK